MRIISRTAIISKNTHNNLDNLLDHLTKVWNWGLWERRETYKKTKKTLSFFDQCKDLTSMRNKEDCNWDNYNRRFQHSILKRLDNAHKKFFADKLYLRGKGFVRFKGERGIRSFENFEPPKIKKNGNKWKFSFRSLGVFKWKKELEYPMEKLKLIRIIKTPLRVMIQFVFDVEKKLESLNDIPIGIDLGIKNRITFSDGNIIPQYKIDDTKLKKLQRKISKAKKGSSNRKKKRISYQKEWQRITDRNKGILHEITTNIIKNISNNLIIEDLDIKNLTKKEKYKINKIVIY